MSENTHKFNLNAAFNLKSLTIDKGTLSTLSNSLEDAFKGPIQNAVSEFQKQIDAKKPSGKSPASGKETTLKLGGVKEAAGSFAKEVSKVLTKELASTSIKLNIDKTAATNAFKSIFNAVVADMKAHPSDGGPPGGSGSPPSGGGGSGDDVAGHSGADRCNLHARARCIIGDGADACRHSGCDHGHWSFRVAQCGYFCGTDSGHRSCTRHTPIFFSFSEIIFCAITC